MPQHKQFEKSLVLNEQSRLRNRTYLSRMRTAVKKVLAASTKEEAQTMFRDATSVIDSTARKGIIKKETAARKKSRLSKYIGKMQA
jgi:small subunit ribosomal protein S20